MSEHFPESELACKCCGFFVRNDELEERLERMRELDGDRGLPVISGCRCPKHNAEEGGKPNGAHPKGEAADLEVKSLKRLLWLVYLAGRAGFPRIGVGWKNLKLHVDVSRTLPKRMWFYD